MNIEQKCLRKGCLYTYDISNNVSYCCTVCMNTTGDDYPHGLECEKKLIIEKLIYCSASGGFNDILTQLMSVTDYAVKYNYSIILKSGLYPSCKYSDIFDFSDYPCKIYVDNEGTELIKKVTDAGFKRHSDTSASVFHLTKTYKPELILVRAGMKGHNNHIVNKYIKSCNFFYYVKLNKSFKKLVETKLELMPKIYYGLHIRNTDHWAKCNISLIHTYLMSIPNTAIVLATDNKELLNTLCAHYNNIIPTGSLDKILSKKYGSLHFSFINDPDGLKNAILDVIVIASAVDVKTTLDFGGYSGFSKLIDNLHADKNLLAHVLS